MSGTVKRMSQIKQLLQMYRHGMGRKEISRALGVSKNTVKSYLQKVETGEMEVDRLLEMEDPLLEGQFHAGNPSYKDPRYIYLDMLTILVICSIILTSIQERLFVVRFLWRVFRFRIIVLRWFVGHRAPMSLYRRWWHV